MHLLILLFCFYTPISDAAINVMPSSHNPISSSENLISSGNKKLLLAINLIAKTKSGKELMPYIDELLQQGKINLTKFQNGHFGESGEGCIIKNGQYDYEGLFILLNNTLSISELASSLVHEIYHYSMIKDIVALGFNFPVKVAAFEISAFASQYEFISELESLQLANSKEMFAGDAKTIAIIMHNAYKLRINWSENGYQKVFNQLVNFGYPINELNRTISQRTEENCFGKITH